MKMKINKSIIMNYNKIYQSNYQAVTCIGGLVRSIIGTHKCIKCVVDNGEARYVRDVSLLLQLLEIEHPMGQYVASVCRGFVKQYKTGGSTLLYFISSFVKAANLLQDQGIPTTAVIQILQAALDDIIIHVSELTTPVNVMLESQHAAIGPEHTVENVISDLKTNTTVTTENKLLCHSCQINYKVDGKEEIKHTYTRKVCTETEQIGGNTETQETEIDNDSSVVRLQMKTNEVEHDNEIDWFFEGLVDSINVVESVSSEVSDEYNKKQCTTEEFMDRHVIEGQGDTLPEKVKDNSGIGTVTKAFEDEISNESDSWHSNNCDTTENRYIGISDNIIDKVEQLKLDIENDLKVLANRKLNFTNNGIKKNNHIETINKSREFDISESEYDDWFDSVKYRKKLNRTYYKHLPNITIGNTEVNGNSNETLDTDEEFDDCFDTVTGSNENYAVNSSSESDRVKSIEKTCDKQIRVERIFPDSLHSTAGIKSWSGDNYDKLGCEAGGKDRGSEDEFSSCFDDTAEPNNNFQESHTVIHHNTEKSMDTREADVDSCSFEAKPHCAKANYFVSSPISEQAYKPTMCTKPDSCTDDMNSGMKKSGANQPTISGLDGIIAQLGKTKTSGMVTSALRLSSRYLQNERTNKDKAGNVSENILSNKTHSETVKKVSVKDTEEEATTEYPKKGIIKNAFGIIGNTQPNIQDINILLCSIGKKEANSLSSSRLTEIKSSSRHLHSESMNDMVENFNDDASTSMTSQSNHTECIQSSQSLYAPLTDRSTLAASVGSRVVEIHTEHSDIYNTNNHIEHDKCEEDTDVEKTGSGTNTTEQLGKSKLNLKAMDSVLSKLNRTDTTRTSSSSAALSQIKTSSRHLNDHYDDNKGKDELESKLDVSEQHLDQAGISHLHSPGVDHRIVHDIVTGLCIGADQGVISVIEEAVIKSLKNNNQALADYGSLLSDRLYCHIVVGSSRQPCLVEGLVLATTSSNVTSLQTLPMPCNALIVKADIKPLYRHKGYKKSAKSSAVMAVETLLQDDHLTKADQWLAEIVSILDELNVGLILSNGQICEEFKSMCNFTGRVAMETVPYQLLDIFCDSSETNMVSYVTLATEINVCRNITVSPWHPDWMDRNCFQANSKQEVVISMATNNPQTVIFSELTHPLADLKEQEFWDCLHRVTSSFNHGSLLPGGGLTESQCIVYCLQRTGMEKLCHCSDDRHLDYLPQAYEVLAGVFQEYVDTVQANMLQDKAVYVADSPTSTCGNTATEDNSPTISQSLKSGLNNKTGYSKMSQVTRQNLGSMNTAYNESELKLSGHGDYNKNIWEHKSGVIEPSMESDSYQGHSEGHTGLLYDDYRSKTEAWKLAMKTMAIVLKTDAYIITGISKDEAHTRLQDHVVTL